jgi:hypothetical protein
MRGMDGPDRDLHARTVAAGAATDVMETKAETRAKLLRIEALLGYLTTKILLGQPLAATDDPVLAFFQISPKNPDPLKRIAEIGARYAKMLGIVECPSCGSSVKDVEGVTNEVCGFCGATVTTEK